MAEREILFRGKGNRKYNSGGWYYGYLSKDCDGDYVITEIGFSRTVIPSTVGQYTGLTDKNGVRIFEGDIIDYAAEKFVVKYIDAFATFDLRSPCNMAKLKPPLQSCMSEKFYAVIGNVHDNPELLKGE